MFCFVGLFLSIDQAESKGEGEGENHRTCWSSRSYTFSSITRIDFVRDGLLDYEHEAVIVLYHNRYIFLVGMTRTSALMISPCK